MELDIDAWRRLAARAFGQLDVQPADENAFRATIREAELEDVHLFDMRSGPHTVTKTERHVGLAETAFCKLSLQIDGRCTLTQNDRRADLEPGDLALYVTSRPYELRFPGEQHSMVVTFPRSAIHMSDEQLELVTATRLSRSSGLGRVAVPLFEQLAANLDLLAGAHAISLVRSALDILVTVLSAEAREAGRDSSENVLFHQAAAYIDEHLGDIEMTPETVAEALYVSLRQLQARFSERGLTIATFIRSRRLAAIRRDLSNPLLAHESVHALSARSGLVNASHVSRAYKSAYGESPTEYRRRVMRGEAGP